MQRMNWEKLLSAKRMWVDKEYDFDVKRSPFLVDMDRIIFSDHFRRLDKKTQVHPLKTNDNVHSRLPHSLEASSVGRSLGIAIGYEIKDQLPENITPEHLGQIMQAACLAHDIGNPPFGHAGEDAISSWFRENESRFLSELSVAERNDFKHFEGNAQALRVLGRLDAYGEEGGMRLTYASVAAMMKYPWVHGRIKKDKYNCFQNEIELLKMTALNTGMIMEGEDDLFYKRHPLAYLSEAADDICYTIIDIEDAYELGILSYDEVFQTIGSIPGFDPKGTTDRRKVSYLRATAIGACVEAVKLEFMSRLDEIMSGALPFSHSLIEKCDPKIAEPMKMGKKLGADKIYQDARKTILEIGAYTVIGNLLEYFCSAVKDFHENGEDMSSRSRQVMRIMGDLSPSADESLYRKYLRVTDYVSGMTDNYATYISKQLSGGA